MTAEFGFTRRFPVRPDIVDLGAGVRWHSWEFDPDADPGELTDLDDVERAAADRLLPGDRRDQYVARHLVLRQRLGAAQGIRPGQVVLDRRCRHCGHDTHGRPTATGPGAVEFNLSHSAGLTVLAIADVPVGVDVERRDRLTDVSDRLLELCCGPAERRWVADRAPAKRPTAFLRLWTRKEAAAKAVGLGLRASFAAIGVLDPPDGLVRVPGAERPLTLYGIEWPDAVAAVAVAAGPAR